MEVFLILGLMVVLLVRWAVLKGRMARMQSQIGAGVGLSAVRPGAPPIGPGAGARGEVL